VTISRGVSILVATQILEHNNDDKISLTMAFGDERVKGRIKMHSSWWNNVLDIG
jgi:hypothetical protein